MERGESSNLEMKYIYSRRPKSGIVINDPNPEQRPKCDMPISIVTRIMKKILPPHAKISDEAKEMIQECVTEFINFITNEANAKCNQEFRRTVTPEDVLKAMGTLGFDNYAKSLTMYLNKHRAQDLDREPVPELQYRPDPPTIVQRPVAQRPLPPPAPNMMHRSYVPLLPPTYDGTYYLGFPAMNKYFMGSVRGGGEGCSKYMEEFDPFK